MACIYYIKNKKNGRMYIGQTVQNLEDRIKQHLRGNTEVDKDMRYFGIDAFDYGVIEYCKSEDLDNKEIYYISKYDTYFNGYNNQLGGRKTGKNKYDDLIDDIRKDYINGMSMLDLNIKYKIAISTIRYFIQGLEKGDNCNFYGNTKKSIICYSKDWVRVHEFESINDAYKFLISNGYTDRCRGNFFYFMRAACNKSGICCGFRWQYKDDLLYDNKEFNSSIDKIGYMQGKECVCRDNIWYIVSRNEKTITKNINEIQNKQSYKKLQYTNDKESNCNKICAQCGKQVVFSHNLCSSCYNVMIRGKSQKPSKEQLIDDLKTLNIGEVAIKYDRTVSTIYYWLNDYEINKKSKRATANKLIHCEELNISFKTLRDAAKTVYKSDSDNTASFISLAARNGSIYRGYHWKLIDKQ